MSDDVEQRTRKEQLEGEYLNFRFMKMTPPSSFIIQTKNSVYLFGFMTLLLVINVFLYCLCSFYSYPLLMNDFNQYHDIGDKKFYQILSNMTKHDNYCFRCIERNLGTEALQAYIEKDSISRERNENLKITRTVLNILSIVTSLATFIVFGGSKLICLISLCSSSLIFASIYVETIPHVVLFEASAILLSLVIFLKCLYVVYFACIVIENQKNR